MDLTQEFLDRTGIGEVGSELVSETDRVRVWHIHARPGERLKVHTHVLDYFWTILGPGRARNHLPDGRTLTSTIALETRRTSVSLKTKA